MKKIFTFSILLISLVSFGQKKGKTALKQNPMPEKNVTVYTSSDSTSLRISKSDNVLKFKELKQPLETQTCIFINPDKKFQAEATMR